MKKIQIETKIKEEFNAVIKGVRFDPRVDPFYKLTSINIPKDIQLIDDGVFSYRLYGFAKEFRYVEPFEKKNSDGLRLNIPEFLGFYSGAVIPVGKRVKEAPYLLKIPGIIFTRDQRIFVRGGIENFYDLEKVLSNLIGDVGGMFSDEGRVFSYIYNNYLSNKKD